MKPSRFATQLKAVDRNDKGHFVDPLPEEIGMDLSDISVASIEKLLARGLTPKKSLFILYYMSNGFNATRAAESAGYSGSISSMGNTGWWLLREPGINTALMEMMSSVAMRPVEIISRLGAMADGSLPTKTSVGPRGTTKVFDTHSAVESIGKHFNLFASRLELSGPDGGPIDIDIGTAARESLISRLLPEASSENEESTVEESVEG